MRIKILVAMPFFLKKLWDQSRIFTYPTILLVLVVVSFCRRKDRQGFVIQNKYEGVVTSYAPLPAWAVDGKVYLVKPKDFLPCNSKIEVYVSDKGIVRIFEASLAGTVLRIDDKEPLAMAQPRVEKLECFDKNAPERSWRIIHQKSYQNAIHKLNEANLNSASAWAFKPRQYALCSF